MPAMLKMYTTIQLLPASLTFPTARENSNLKLNILHGDVTSLLYPTVKMVIAQEKLLTSTGQTGQEEALKAAAEAPLWLPFQLIKNPIYQEKPLQFPSHLQRVQDLLLPSKRTASFRNKNGLKHQVKQQYTRSK